MNEALTVLSAGFSAMYSRLGQSLIPPEKLLRALLLQEFYSIRSERLLMERLEFGLLFRWFVGIGVDDAAWDHSTFSKYRDRLLEGDIAAKFMQAVLDQPRVKQLLSRDHFSVDGALIEAWASMKSFRPKDGSDEPMSSGGGRNVDSNFQARTKFRGRERVGWAFTFATAGYNLARLPKLLAAASAAETCRLLGRWRIVEADIWDRAYLDLCGPATLTVTAQGGEIAFGAMEASLHIAYARDSINFRWYSADEGDLVEGEGSAELLEDGTLEIEYSYYSGDEAVIKAKRETSSTAC